MVRCLPSLHMALRSTPNMVNIKGAGKGNVIVKGMEKELMSLEELTTERTSQGEESLGERGEGCS